MLSESATILPIIIAGLLNGSFVIPAKYIKNSSHEFTWLSHSIIGLALVPWIFFLIISPSSFNNYLHLPPFILVFIIFGGVTFGLGQLWFINAIELLGIGLSFAINLSIGLTIGSMFVIFYKSEFFSKQGLYVSLAIALILCSLIFYYHANNLIYSFKTEHFANKLNYLRGWLLASLAGFTSGLQNITFFIVIQLANHYFKTTDMFWVWPPFLLAASIPMVLGFKQKMVISNKSNISDDFLSFRDLFLITCMGLCFTGSLAIYSKGMSQMNHHQQILAWPAFVVSIIFASQIWGNIYQQQLNSTLKSKLYRVISLILLIISIIILANQS